MNQLNTGHEHDRLRAQFTSWLTTLLRRARIDYLRRQERMFKTVSLDETNEAELVCEDKYASLQSEFEFEEERLAMAFFSLSLKRQQVLTMLFVQDMTPTEISRKLHCSVDYVYMLRKRGLEALKRMLIDEEGL